MESTSVPTASSRIATVAKLPHLPGYDWLTVPALRHLIFLAKSRRASNGDLISGNGLEEVGAIIRIGRKVLIDLDRFGDWVERHRELPGRSS